MIVSSSDKNGGTPKTIILGQKALSKFAELDDARCKGFMINKLQAKAKEVQPHAQADPKTPHLILPNRTTAPNNHYTCRNDS